jgi:hypothetical protein
MVLKKVMSVFFAENSFIPIKNPRGNPIREANKTAIDDT